MLTERDLAILRWINGHGIADARKVSEKFAIYQQKTYLRLKRLVDAGLLKHERILFGKPGVYYLTKAGVEASGSELTVINKVVLSTMEHDLKLVDLSIFLEKERGGKWVTAREIMLHKVTSAKNKIERLKLLKTRTADGLLVTEEQTFAVELELTMKSQQRLKKIIEDYARDIQKGVYNGVLYYCGNKEIGLKVLDFVKGTAANGKIEAYTFIDKNKIEIELPKISQQKISMDFDFSKFRRGEE